MRRHERRQADHLERRDRLGLESVLAKRVAHTGHARRARVVLLSSEGVRGVEIARRLSLSIPQVSRIRRRFFEGGVEGLRDQPKAGRGNSIPEPMVRRIVATAVSPPPAGYSHWSTSRPSWPTGTRIRLPSSGPNLLTASSAITANSLRESRGRNTRSRGSPSRHAILGRGCQPWELPSAHSRHQGGGALGRERDCARHLWRRGCVAA
jgi:DNA-binding CsgD family transcriptional regulator